MKILKKYIIKIVFILIIILITIILLFSQSNKPYKALPKIVKDQKYKVIKVIDGDTLEISIDNKIYTMRMLGIDTPETVDPRKPVQCYGKEASDNTRKLLQGKFIRIEIDQSQRYFDKYNRILAYVYDENHNFINEMLIKYGYAREYTYDRKYKYQSLFRDIEREARVGKIGMWSDKCNYLALR